MDVENRKLVAAAATEFVNKIGNEIDFLFRPRYTQFDENKKEQTNPYVKLAPYEQTEVVVEGLLMTLAQIAASAASDDSKIDTQTVVANMTRKLRSHVDTYHQMFLHMKETQKNENGNKGTKAGDVSDNANISDNGPEGVNN